MIVRWFVLVVTLSALMVAVGPPRIDANDAHCETWAADYNYPRNSYRMRQLGCDDSAVPGVYEATPGICGRIARQAGRAGLRGHDAVQYVEAKDGYTCYWDADARRYMVASQAW